MAYIKTTSSNKNTINDFRSTLLLIEDLKLFIVDYSSTLFITLFFVILGYGYFITTWTLSIDGEIHTFDPIGHDWIAQGRIFDSIFAFLINYRVIPFFDNFLSVVLLFFSSIVWCITLNKLCKNSKLTLLVFLLIYNISPIYCFILQFTMSNVLVSACILLCSIAIYHTSIIYIFKNLNHWKHYIISIILLFFTISVYEIFTIYYITGVIFILTIMIIQSEFTEKPINQKIEFLKLSFKAILILFISIILYVIIPKLILHLLKIIKNSYTDNYFHWGNSSFSSNIRNICEYFGFLLHQSYSFNLLFTLVFSIFLVILLAIRLGMKSTIIIQLILMLIVSPFILIFAFGTGMPFRTLIALPLMMAGISFLLLSTLKNKLIKNIIFSIVFICTFFNAQFINRIFYGDHMRLQYDMNFANLIYSKILDKAGEDINKKPLVIIGHHSYRMKPFIICSNYDPIGCGNFFEWERMRIAYFMQWLGDDYIEPSVADVAKAKEIAKDIPSWPSNKSIIMTPDLIIIKLSNESN